MKKLARLTLLVVTAFIVTAHVGTSNAYFEGTAGPYGVRVTVRMPGVVPGLAQITVRILTGTDVQNVTVRPIRWDAGVEGAPPADTASHIGDDTNLYGAELWLMSFGSYSVQVTVDGAEGTGTAVVPVLAVAEKRLDMSRPMAIALLGAGVFLFLGALTIFGTATRESVLAPGVQPNTTHRTKGRIATAGGGIGLMVVLWGGWQWWGAVDASYRSGLFKPLETSASISIDNNRPVLDFNITDRAWMNRQWTPLIPDHGKLMHMFAVRDDDLSSFAHIHPVSIDSNSFRVTLPPLPAGNYRLYGDIVHESGFAQTLTDTIFVPDATDEPLLATPSPTVDPDDSWTTALPYGEARTDNFVLPTGQIMRWQKNAGPFVVDDEISLTFVVANADGTPSRLEPYMGMLSHAAVTNTDGSVFVHLHPTGSISMAAQKQFATNGGGEMQGHTTTEPSESHTSTVSFPFAFPRAGAYRIFVQVRIDGEVLTGMFDVDVANE